MNPARTADTVRTVLEVAFGNVTDLAVLRGGDTAQTLGGV